MTIRHAFITRFNLPSAGPESLIRAREGWLRERIELFERYTVPSVRAQTVRSAAWLVYLDEESPAWLIDRMAELAAEGLLQPLLRVDVPAADLRADLARLVDGDPDDVLITTNLDNDDGLAHDFVARLVALETPEPRTAVYLSRGLIKSPGGLYLRRDPVNAFCSVREALPEPVTCWADWHNLLGRSMPVTVLDGRPAWLQVVHGSNVSNRVRGRRVSPAAYRDLFGDQLDDVAEPGRVALLADRTVGVCRRGGREGLRSVGKRVIMALIGKNGLDAVKLRLQQLRRA